MEKLAQFRKGILPLVCCYGIWGVQPMYWALFGDTDNLFLMASRVIWAAVSCVALVALQGKLTQLGAVFRSRSLFLREFAAMVFLAADWFIYLIAVRTGHVLEACMGYYIEPFVVFAFGALVFHETITWKHFVILGILAVGICFSSQGVGSAPQYTVLLALSFAFYSAIKKGLEIDSIVSTTAEILIMFPFMLAFILLFRRGDNGLASVDGAKLLLLMGSGIITAAPMLLFALGVKHLPLTALGIFQYMSPTIALICSLLFMGETMTPGKLIGFLLTWVGVIGYMVIHFRTTNAAEQ